MAIQETLTGSSTSLEVNPTATISEFSMEGGSLTGRVELQSKAPGASEWRTLAKNTSSPIHTPDLNYLYRFKSTVVTSVKVYFGP